MWLCTCTEIKTVCNLVNGNLVYLLFMKRFIPVTLGKLFNLFTADDLLSFDFILHFSNDHFSENYVVYDLSIEITVIK